ncbi:unnamed protein product [Arabis nemorensis]|uniref:Glycylpeptide N-tetradecanoyltransferase n=1 Tax=Arabis nemorensis TaxID=586526 RepID=A0A565BBH6_9BRAS|nr:unnamed protein product [Arabis nemorensis]
MIGVLEEKKRYSCGGPRNPKWHGSMCVILRRKEGWETTRKMKAVYSLRKAFSGQPQRPRDHGCGGSCLNSETGMSSLLRTSLLYLQLFGPDLKEMEPLSDREEVGKSSKIQSQNMPKSQPFSKEEKSDQILEAKDDTFWETQPAGQFNDIGDASLPEGPIEPRTPLSEVKQEPYGILRIAGMLESVSRPQRYLLVSLLRDYLSQFGVATEFDEIDVEHWFLPIKDVVHSYLVESPETHEVTDFCSFYNVTYTIAGNPKYTTVECAYSFYNVATSISFPQLMKDALIVSKKKGFHVFYALDVLHNESFLKELKFKEGDGQMHYYLYNYGLRSALKPSELGLLL